jgi:hypothetical protein
MRWKFYRFFQTGKHRIWEGRKKHFRLDQNPGLEFSLFTNQSPPFNIRYPELTPNRQSDIFHIGRWDYSIYIVKTPKNEYWIFWDLLRIDMGSNIFCETVISEMGFPSASFIDSHNFGPQTPRDAPNFCSENPSRIATVVCFWWGFEWGDFCRENLGIYKMGYIL